MREYISTESERKYRRKYYEANRERILQRRKGRYLANREKENEASKAYAMSHDRSAYWSDHRARKKEGKIC